jgi:L-ascorbate metabolism protein UlaG (beta-lactamase superfamily)
MLDNLHWLGHACFRLDCKKVIYFDPFQLPRSSIKADIILITHEHFDHCSFDDLKLISTKDTLIVTAGAAGKELANKKIICKEIKSLLPNQNIEIEDIKINAVASYNTNKHFHPKGSNNLGFILTLDGVKIYHAGDTDFIPEMKNIQCDIALLPVSGTYVMTADEAAQTALAIKPKVAIPMHYSDVVGSEKDAKRFQDLLKNKVEVRILEKEI